jgi:hypothetical protein
MKDHITISNRFRIITIAMAIAGMVTFIIGMITDPAITWASYLVSVYYFLSLAIGAAFFLAIQKITQSGWSSAFKRVPEAMAAWIPVCFVFFLLLWFGRHQIYEWSLETENNDLLLQHKSPYLNMPFFFIRMIISFIVWIVILNILRRISLKEDTFDPSDEKSILGNFHRGEMYSKIFIFILAVTFTFMSFDWIMSIEPHWYSSVFAFKNFIGAFLHGVAIIALIVFILHRQGYFPFLNQYHLHDFARYIFIVSIIWGYLWFAQFMIIWYGNIPEETNYYFYRWHEGWKVFFWLQMALNWGLPFLILLPVQPSRNMKVITSVIVILIIGHYVDIFVQVMPAISNGFRMSWIDAGLFIGFAGLFCLVVATALSKAKIVPENHPYLIESLEHEFE